MCGLSPRPQSTWWIPVLSVPSPDTPQSRKPVESFAELVDDIAAGCKPPDAWRIGTEHEKFGFRTDDLTPIPYEGDRGVRAMLEGMQEKSGWDAVMEGENIIGLTSGGEVRHA